MSDLKLDVDQAGELKAGFRRGDWTNADIKLLSEADKATFSSIRLILLGCGVVSVIKHLIDCDTAPFCPDIWTVEDHHKDGQLVFDPANIQLYLCNGQMDGRSIEGHKLRKELAKMHVMNANVLDYLVAHPELIPDSWKTNKNGNTHYIYFFGTIYRNGCGRLYVRFLYWRGCRWQWNFLWLGGNFNGYDPAAVLAS